MRRRAIKFLTGLSLLLCVAVVAVWVRSRFAADQVIYGYARPSLSGLDVDYRAFTILSARGNVVVLCQGGLIGDVGWSYASVPPGEPDDFVYLPRGTLGFRIDEWDPAGYLVLSFPLWPLLLLLAALPFCRAYRRVRRPNKPGLCPACSYDLRATPDRCPECGTAAAGTTA